MSGRFENAQAEQPPSGSPPCYPPVLDPCCGTGMFWFDRTDERAVYNDIRKGVRVIDVGTPGTKGRKPKVVAPDTNTQITDAAPPCGNDKHQRGPGRRSRESKG